MCQLGSQSKILSLVLLASLWGAQTVDANDSVVEEIVVHGELRDNTLMSTPSSVSVISLTDWRAGTVNHLEELLSRAPNVNFSSGASRGRFIQIRGIGERGQFAEPLNPSVGLLLDGVDMSGIGTAATLFDINQVEIFRGPQGTVYGANALAGLINVTSNDPTENFYARLTLDAGDFDSQGIGAVVSGPLGERLGFRIALKSYRDDGFIKNAFLGRDNTANHDERTFRGKLVWSPNDQSDLTFNIGRIDVDNGYDNFSLDNDRITLSDQPGQDIQETTYASLKWAAEWPNTHRLEVSIGHTDSDIDYGYDEDWTFVGFHPFGYSSTDRYLRDRQTTTFDARLLSGPVSGSRLFDDTTDWVIGAFALRQSVALSREYTFLPAPFASDFEIDRFALYGELTHHLNERTRLTVGLRGEQHRAEYRDTEAVRFDPTDTLLGGRLQIERDLTNGALLYAGVTRGYKAGGFNTSGTLDADLREFDPEVLWNYEVGLKGSWRETKLQARIAIFYMQRDDVQVNTSIIRDRPDGSVEFIDFTGNAAEGTNAGVEVELTWAPTDKLTTFANVGFLETEFEDYINGAGDNLSGRDQAQAPAYQFYLGADYQFERGWYARLEFEGRDEYFFSDSHDAVSDAYALVNASIGYGAERWAVKLWARNLTDEDVFVRGFFFGNDPRDGYTPRGFTQLGEPRRIGMSVSFSL
ncbi:MAG: TonB-dependent receptor [Bacteroidetes bacterium]|nr:TonB-dependent receptor [Bacteroidota bacterium]